MMKAAQAELNKMAKASKASEAKPKSNAKKKAVQSTTKSKRPSMKIGGFFLSDFSKVLSYTEYHLFPRLTSSPNYGLMYIVSGEANFPPLVRFTTTSKVN